MLYHALTQYHGLAYTACDIRALLIHTDGIIELLGYVNYAGVCNTLPYTSGAFSTKYITLTMSETWRSEVSKLYKISMC
ncbi:hypothetical protein TNIN_378741 [Trichonephila inaurata madagascariensis]|uniref:Uncharacterized protein n=1 Tax=Trichonephila inaurata madagascariensis TaxID=2747483 RepID=A0A8X6YWD2_9ARAC|nr:hypothetical protein TNIN_378741 [Trichonephila inaurata madagascariensis]